ncbi:hypothetical protein PQX77_011670 [Marasmius sp. AFHP31]|nr:hypothetical protein PQX77_011670 [Marasmius sp. AFHP31]
MERLDDTVPSLLVYTPASVWEIGGVDGEYNSTTHGTRIAGARMQFIFTGTGIDVYSTKSFNMSTAPATNRFTVDGGDPVTWSASPNPDQVFDTSMFSTRGLSEGTHTLVMEVTVENSETWIDYLQVHTGYSNNYRNFHCIFPIQWTTNNISSTSDVSDVKQYHLVFPFNYCWSRITDHCQYRYERLTISRLNSTSHGI